MLFLGARYDYTCETATSRLAEPMRRAVHEPDRAPLRLRPLDGAGEAPEVNAALVDWLARRVPDAWPLAAAGPQPAEPLAGVAARGGAAGAGGARAGGAAGYGAASMGLPLRFGVVHDFRCPPGSDVPMPRVYAETFEQIELVERWGLDLCWFTEHHFIDDGYLPNFVPVAGAAAARTSRLRFSTDICLLPFRHPVRLAEDLAILDNISRWAHGARRGHGLRRARVRAGSASPAPAGSR